MTNIAYIPPYQRVLHQAGIKALLMVQFVTVLPFMTYMPKWFLLVFALVLFWRWRVLRGELRKPPRTLLITAVVAGIGGLVFSGLNRYSLDTAVAFCLLGYLLKSLEVLRRRDGIFQIYLGFFLAGVFLLYRFDPLAGLIMIILLIVNLIALQAVTSDVHFNWRYALTQSLIMVVAAIPVMIAGYLFFPRIPPLWSIPNDERGATTGMTDELTPGSIADLARSNEPAFRVSFSSTLPPRSQWYWRGTTMTLFDGNTWKAKYSDRNIFSWPLNKPLPTSEISEYDYTVIMENSGRRWLYFLDWPTSITGDNIRILPDGRAAKEKPISSVFRYNAQSSNSVQWDDQTTIIRDSLLLPDQGNEALKQWAIDRRQERTSDTDFVNSIGNYIRNENFYYTLRPPLYVGEQSLESFWFGDRRGFCAHFASASAFIFRSAGIPTRLVGGYLGGTYVSQGNYIQVRQMEAHVWLEVWLNEQWVRFDPTAAVAPNRVETNLDDLFAETQPSDLPVFSRLGQFGLINQLNIFWDSLEYKWQVLILDYDNQQALGWFEKSFGRLTAMKLAIGILTLMGSVALVVAFSLGMIKLPTRKSEPFKSLAKLEKWYGVRMPGETIDRYFARLKHANPKHTALDGLGKLIQEQLYKSGHDLRQSDVSLVLKNLNQQRSQYPCKT
jgi:transglutaminase-like putative cysteine protease